MKDRPSAHPQSVDSRWAVTHRQAAITVPVAVAALLLLAAIALAQGGYDLSWHVVSGGGGHSEAYPPPQSLDGAVVQPAGAMYGGSYELQSGFLSGMLPEAPLASTWYLPVVVKGLHRP